MVPERSRSNSELVPTEKYDISCRVLKYKSDFGWRDQGQVYQESSFFKPESSSFRLLRRIQSYSESVRYLSCCCFVFESCSERMECGEFPSGSDFRRDFSSCTALSLATPNL